MITTRKTLKNQIKSITMGTLNQNSPPLPQETPPLLQDLKVTIQDAFLVFPSQETEKRSMFLSNIDQALNFDVPTLHFFASHKDFPPHLVAKKLKNALEKILVVAYDFLAGRLKLNPSTGRFEFECNGAGIVMAVASSECKLEEIGDLVYPNPAFEQLVSSKAIHHHLLKKDQDKPLCFVQVTCFQCGGFAIGISTNHTTFDGISFKTFLENLAAAASDKPLPVAPCNDRQLLAARSPPRVTFPHPELLKLNTHLGGLNAPVFDTAKGPLDFKIFRLTSAHVSALKEKGKAHPDCRVSGFNAVTAHIWRCKALSFHAEQEKPERVSTVLYAVNIRPRLEPPLPASYAGNAVLSAYASATCRELKEEGLPRLVEKISEGAERMSDEYARSVIDWGEVNKGFPDGEVLVSSWWRLGFDKVEYPWGSPLYSCPLVSHRKDIILLLPDIQDKDGVNVLVALPSHQMSNFQHLFHAFLLP